ncbi:hypothetical protein JIN85_13905 [Luteolibacter pohnpeiensis]|uniref:Uncharacterized protein n=1 Tax=Luteolibacter pohnpeiensis TaxID=454153 RepID=A0A934S797_9BACT|nr:hypothetical protein [Luteolibacter pohnpeiensis]MBK1883517.1 hypothetical protein [Luteolibacter pohnpeiensis]
MDDLLLILLKLLWLPFAVTKKMVESSRLGSSELDRQALEWWKRVAIAGTVIILAVVGILWWMFGR